MILVYKFLLFLYLLKVIMVTISFYMCYYWEKRAYGQSGLSNNNWPLSILYILVISAIPIVSISLVQDFLKGIRYAKNQLKTKEISSKRRYE